MKELRIATVNQMESLKIHVKQLANSIEIQYFQDEDATTEIIAAIKTILNCSLVKAVETV